MSSLVATLDDFRRRLRYAVAVRDAAYAAAVLSGGCGAIAATDAAWGIDSAWVRFAAVALVLLTTVALLRRLVRGLGPSDWNLVRMALLLERVRPEWRDQLAGAVAMVIGRSGTQSALSAQLAAAAERALGDGTTSVRINLRPVARATAALVLVLGAWIGWSIGDPSRAAVALQRVLLPFTAPDWPRSVVLNLLDEQRQPFTGERRLTVAGEPLTLYIENARGGLPRDLRLEQAAADGPNGTLPLTRTTLHDADGRDRKVAVATLTPAPGVLRLRACGGDDLTMPWQEFDVRPAPRLERFRVRVVPPAYSGLAATDDERSGGHVAGLIGSQVTVNAAASVPLAAAVWHRDGHTAESIVLHTPTELELRFAITAEGRSTYWIELADELGLGPARPQKYEIQGRRDQPPTVQWRQPAGPLTAVPSAVLPLTVTAGDDFGLHSVDLVWTSPDSASPAGRRSLRNARPEAPPSAEQRTAQRIDWNWELSPLRLPLGAIVECRVEAVDARNPDPQLALTPPLRITIVSPEDKRRENDERLAELAAAVDRLVTRHTELDVVVEELRTQAAIAGTLRAYDREQIRRLDRERRRTVSDLTDDRAGVRAQLWNLHEQMRWNHLAESAAIARLSRLEDRLRFLVETGLPEFGHSLGTLQQVVAPVEVTEPEPDSDAVTAIDTPRFEAACAEVRKSHEVLRSPLAEMQSELQAWRRLTAAAELLEAVLAGQRETRQSTVDVARETLSRGVDGLSPQQRATLATLAARQRRLAEALDRLQTPLAAGDAVSQPRSPPPMFETVVVAGRMSQAADDIAANRTSAAVQGQTDVISDLEDALRQLTAGDPEDRRQEFAHFNSQAEQLLQRQLAWQLRWLRLPAAPIDRSRAAERVPLQTEQTDLDQRLAVLADEIGRSALTRSPRRAAQAATMSRNLRAALAAEQDAGVGGLSSRLVVELQRLKQDLATEQRSFAQSLLAEALSGLAAELPPVHQAQSDLLTKTISLEDRHLSAGRRSRADLKQLAAATRTQQQLAEQLAALAGRLDAGLLPGAVLREAAAQMQTAATGLAERRTDAAVTDDQRAAAARLAAVIAAIPDPEATFDAGDATAISAPEGAEWIVQRIELSLLRSLQVDLQHRTAALRQQLAEQPAAPALLKQRHALAAEQEALAARAAALWEQQRTVAPTRWTDEMPQH